MGSSTAEIRNLVNTLMKKQVRVIAIKQNLDIKQHLYASFYGIKRLKGFFTG